MSGGVCLGQFIGGRLISKTQSHAARWNNLDDHRLSNRHHHQSLIRLFGIMEQRLDQITQQVQIASVGEQWITRVQFNRRSRVDLLPLFVASQTERHHIKYTSPLPDWDEQQLRVMQFMHQAIDDIR